MASPEAWDRVMEGTLRKRRRRGRRMCTPRSRISTDSYRPSSIAYGPATLQRYKTCNVPCNIHFYTCKKHMYRLHVRCRSLTRHAMRM